MAERKKWGKKTTGTQSKPWFNGDLPVFFSLFTLVSHHEKPMVESLGILLVFDAWNFQANPSPEKKSEVGTCKAMFFVKIYLQWLESMKFRTFWDGHF